MLRGRPGFTGELIGEVVQKAMKDRGTMYTHDKFFKEAKTNALVRDHVMSSYAGAK